MKRKTLKLVISFIISFFIFSLAGCSIIENLISKEKDIPPVISLQTISISLEGETSFYVGDFDISKYKIILTFNDGTKNKVALTSENLSDSDIQKLSTVGVHEVKITYDTLETKVTFNVLEISGENATLSFIVDGEKVYSCNVELGKTLTKEYANSIYQDEKTGMVGYKVDKWYSSSTLQDEYTFGGQVNSNVNLYGESKYFVNSLLNNELLAKFNNALTTKKLAVSSRDELTSFAFYSIFMNVTVSNAPDLELKYLGAPNSTNILSELQNACENASENSNFNSGAEITRSTYGTTGKIYIESSSLSNYASKSFNSTNLYKQQEFATFKTFDSTRDNTFDDFNINKVATEISISSSEQLCYALEMGFKPVCAQNSKAEIIYTKAKAVLREIISDSMTNTDKVYSIYNWLINNVQYDNYAYELSKLNQITAEQSREYDSWFAEGVFNSRKAVCEGFAKAFLIMAKLENIPCIYVTGNGHAWNKVFVNNNWFTIDATHGNVAVGNEEWLTYTEFLVTDEYKTAKGYSTIDHPEIQATTKFDAHDYVELNYNGKYFDLHIDSLIELDTLVNYVKANADTPFIFEITLDNSITINQVAQKFYGQSVSTSHQTTVNNGTAYMISVG